MSFVEGLPAFYEELDSLCAETQEKGSFGIVDVSTLIQGEIYEVLQECVFAVDSKRVRGIDVVTLQPGQKVAFANGGSDWVMCLGEGDGTYYTLKNWAFGGGKGLPVQLA